MYIFISNQVDLDFYPTEARKREIYSAFALRNWKNSRTYLTPYDAYDIFTRAGGGIKSRITGIPVHVPFPGREKIPPAG